MTVMTRRITAALALLGALAAGSAHMLAFQDTDTEAAQQAAREAAAQRARVQQQADRDYKAQQDWLKRSADQSDANLNKMIDTQTPAKDQRERAEVSDTPTIHPAAGGLERKNVQSDSRQRCELRFRVVILRPGSDGEAHQGHTQEREVAVSGTLHSEDEVSRLCRI
jgi:hypothetical protein